MKIISIGEVLWDLVGGHEHLGGAPFNFAAHLRQFGYEVVFVTAVGCDPRGDKVVSEMSRRGLPTRYVTREPNHPTGIVTVQVTKGQPSFTIHRPAAYDYPKLSEEQIGEMLSPQPNWIYYGTLLQMSPPARALVETVLGAAPDARRFYDVNLRTGSYEPKLVCDLLSRADVAKLNEDEVGEVARMAAIGFQTLEQFCRGCAKQFGLETLCVTRGAKGCAVLWSDEYHESDGYQVKVADAIGAGDAFAAAFLHGMNSGFTPAQTADLANRVGAIVASKPGALPGWTIEEAYALA